MPLGSLLPPSSNLVASNKGVKALCTPSSASSSSAAAFFFLDATFVLGGAGSLSSSSSSAAAARFLGAAAFLPFPLPLPLAASPVRAVSCLSTERVAEVSSYSQSVTVGWVCTLHRQTAMQRTRRIQLLICHAKATSPPPHFRAIPITRLAAPGPAGGRKEGWHSLIPEHIPEMLASPHFVTRALKLPSGAGARVIVERVTVRAYRSAWALLQSRLERKNAPSEGVSATRGSARDGHILADWPVG